MASYIHHVPGRLRVKTVAMKRNATLAQSALQKLVATDGVTEASVSTSTGSIIINYDVQVLNEQALLDLLKNGGYINQSPKSVNRVKPTGELARSVSLSGEKIGDVVIGTLTEKLVERSATMLLAALL